MSSILEHTIDAPEIVNYFFSMDSPLPSSQQFLVYKELHSLYYSVNVLLGSLSLASDRNSALLNRKAESFAHVTTKAKQGLIQGSGDVIRTQVFSVRFLALLPLWWFTAQAGSAFYGRWPPTLQFMSSATPKEGKHLFPSCCSQRPRISSKWFSLAWLRSHVPP